MMGWEMLMKNDPGLGALSRRSHGDAATNQHVRFFHAPRHDDRTDDCPTSSFLVRRMPRPAAEKPFRRAHGTRGRDLQVRRPAVPTLSRATLYPILPPSRLA